MMMTLTMMKDTITKNVVPIGKKVENRKEVFDKTQYTKTIDTNFKEFGATTISDSIQSQPTIEQFFELYNQLFYDIPPNGETNSHEFLIQQSG